MQETRLSIVDLGLPFVKCIGSIVPTTLPTLRPTDTETRHQKQGSNTDSGRKWLVSGTGNCSFAIQKEEEEEGG